jgi:hypothetical protein
MHKSLTIKTQLIVFLSAFALFLSVKNRDATFLLASLLSAVSCLLADTAVSFWRQKKIMVTESSLITGLIIGFVLYSKQP